MKNSAFQLCSSNEIESSSFAVVVVLVGQLSNSKILLFSTVRIFIEFVTSFFFFFKNPTPTTRETNFLKRDTKRLEQIITSLSVALKTHRWTKERNLKRKEREREKR